MKEAFLRFEKGQETFQFSFRYVNPEYKVDRQFNFNRKAVEPVSTFLKRIDVNISKIVNEKKKKLMRKKKSKGIVKEEEENSKKDDVEMKIALLQNDSAVEGDVPCEIVFENVSQLSLLILEDKYSIKHNVPWVESITLPQSILVGFPTYPSHFQSVYTNIKDSVFVWYKSILSKDSKKESTWEERGKGFFYIPNSDDLGCRLKLSCMPGNEIQTGPIIEIESPNLVEAGPGRCPFEDRHAFTKEKLTGDR